MQSSNQKSLVLKIKEAFGFTAAFTSVSYILGFLIINSFLISYGATSFSLLNAKYLAVGICFVLFYVVVAIVFVAGPGHKSPTKEWQVMVSKREQTLKKELEELKKKKSKSYIVGYGKGYRTTYAISYFVRYLIVLIISYIRYYTIFLIVLAPIFYFSRSNLHVFYSPYTYLWVLIVTVGFSFLIDFANQEDERKWILVPWILVTLLLSTILYGCHIYPYVSSSIGGGTPRKAYFITDSVNRDLIQLAVNKRFHSNISPELKVILETSDSFMILTKRNQTEQIVQIKKEMVKGVIYQATK